MARCQSLAATRSSAGLFQIINDDSMSSSLGRSLDAECACERKLARLRSRSSVVQAPSSERRLGLHSSCPRKVGPDEGPRMSVTHDRMLANPEQPDLERRLAERTAERDEALAR